MQSLMTTEQYHRKRKFQRLCKKITVPFALIASLSLLGVVNDTRANDCAVVNALSDKQLGVIVKAYHLGAPEGLGYSLSAIAWQESLAGLVKVNYADPSFGLYHISLKTAAKREGITTTFKKNMLAQRLLDDDAYSAYHALAELRYWKTYHKGVWRRIWASYNGGFGWENTSSYADAIAERVRLIQQCVLPLPTKTVKHINLKPKKV